MATALEQLLKQTFKPRKLPKTVERSSVVDNREEEEKERQMKIEKEKQVEKERVEKERQRLENERIEKERLEKERIKKEEENLKKEKMKQYLLEENRKQKGSNTPAPHVTVTQSSIDEIHDRIDELQSAFTIMQNVLTGFLCEKNNSVAASDPAAVDDVQQIQEVKDPAQCDKFEFKRELGQDDQPESDIKKTGASVNGPNQDEID